MFFLYAMIPELLIGFFYHVYLVRRFGGTPGKCIVGLRIRKLDGAPVGYREAILRYLPSVFFEVVVLSAMAYSAAKFTDAEYLALTVRARAHALTAIAPRLHHSIEVIYAAWLAAELIVFFSNRKRRALHDFLAGTVVVWKTQP